MRTSLSLDSRSKTLARAFSLVEVLAAIAIIGIITFLAIPNLVKIKQDGEKTLAIARAEALNMAMSSYLQANGAPNAIAAWAASNDDTRYSYLAQYLSFAPGDLDDYMPGGYSVTLPDSVAPPIEKVMLFSGTSSISY